MQLRVSASIVGVSKRYACVLGYRFEHPSPVENLTFQRAFDANDVPGQAGVYIELDDSRYYAIGGIKNAIISKQQSSFSFEEETAEMLGGVLSIVIHHDPLKVEWTDMVKAVEYIFSGCDCLTIHTL